MQAFRPTPSILTLVLASALSACANTPGQALSSGSVGPALAQPVPPAATQVSASPAKSDPLEDEQDAAVKELREPVIIRGNDRTFNAKPNPGQAKGPVSSFKFENAPTGEVVNVMLRDLLKVDYVVHPPLAGNITLTTRGEVSADKALLLLETALQVNGIVMAKDSRGTYHVGTPEALKGIVAAPRVMDGKAMAPGYGAIIVPLQYLGANEMANILRPMVPPDAIIRVDPMRNVLVMRGTRAEAEGWMDIVNTFDVNLLRGMSVGVFPLKYSTVEDVQTALQLLAGGAAAQPAAAAGQRPATAPTPAGARGAAAAQAPQAAVAESNPLFGAVRIMPIDRINAILVVTPRAAYLDEIRYWIEQFDRPNLNSAEPQLFVYKVRNGSADHLSELLNGIYSGSNAFGPTGANGVAPGLGGTGGLAGNRGTTGGSNNLNRYSGNQSMRSSLSSGSSGGLGATSGARGNVAGGAAGQQGAAAGGNVGSVALSDSVRVMADRINNTLLIYSKPSEYARIEATLKRLDVPRAQVLIDASIVEVSLTEGMTFGAKWNFTAGGGSYTGSGAVNSVAAALPAAGDIIGAGAGFTYMLRNSANPIALLEAQSKNSNIRFLSNPSLMVMDNHTAAISVGEQIPVETTSYNSGGVTSGYIASNYEFKDTGVILNITPQVNAGNLVTMEVDQEVTDLGEYETVGSDRRRRFKQRTLSSKVAVRSGETIVLGGLVKSSETKGKSGLPILSSIPLLGALFGTHESTGDRTELLLVITPRVIRSDEEAREVSQELRDRMKGISDAGWPAIGGALKASGSPKPYISTIEEGQTR